MRDGFAVCWSVVEIILYKIHCFLQTKRILRVLSRSHVLGGAMANSRVELQTEAPAPEIAREDYCQKLPNDLLVVIFTKLLVVNSSISDLKFLFRCSLVSRRFNSIISTTASSIQSLSLINAAEIKKKILKKIMGKFHNLRSFYIEYNELESDLKWKAVYRSGIYCFVALQAKSESYFRSNPVEDLTGSKRISAMMKFHEMMVLLIRRHKMLSSVVIADSKKQGKISFGDELLKELRNDRNYNNDAFRQPQHIDTGVVPELCVPLFGSSPKTVEFLIIKSGTKAPGNDLSNEYIDEDTYTENWGLYDNDDTISGTKPPGNDDLSDEYIDEDTYTENWGLYDNDDTMNWDFDDEEGLYDNDDTMNWDFDDEEKEFGEVLPMILRELYIWN